MSEYLSLYGAHRPTPFDATGDSMVPDRATWYLVPVSRTRDSGILAESNFDAALSALGGESDTVEVHCFGHWGPGWYEIILVDPADAERVKAAEDIACALASYPVLNESDYSEREWKATAEYWANMRLRDRIDLYKCDGQRHGAPFFSVRSESVPEWAEERIRTWVNE